MEIYKNEFIEIFQNNITRDGSAELLKYLTNDCDFFTAPASTRFHGAFEGGLASHSLNVYHCLKDYLQRPRVIREYRFGTISEESIAIAALLHDMCKINVYKKSFRNVKNEKGVWEQVSCYNFEESLPYGHGEKSVYMISGFMKLKREEAMAIRWHMGFSGTEENNTVGKALEMYPLAFALCTADMEASYFLEGSK